jgi:hypothetical protein
VQPTEKERNLKNVDKTEDDELKPEFVSQMKQLKSRIFKRVKLNVLNNNKIIRRAFWSCARPV